MVLPSKEIIQDIRNLIHQITGFGEDEENFYICEQYCLSHVMHHTYPSVNKNEVKRLIDGYKLRFFIHGYFKVADGLDAEVNRFLSSNSLFQKNPEHDIQWVLLGLLTSLATNLSAVTKLPKMMPLIEEEKPIEEINWGEYLKEGLPNYKCQESDEDSNSEDPSYESGDSESFVECEETEEVDKKEEQIESKEVPSIKTFHPSRQHIIDELVKRREEEISYTRDIVLRGNFMNELGFFTSKKTSWERSQLLSEFEVVGYVLKQFLTGENIFLKKGITNPSTCSLTEETIKNYLSAIEPYVNMIAIFKQFNNEVSQLENGNQPKQNFHYNVVSDESLSSNANKFFRNLKKTVPNVVKLYNLALTEALNLFENKILTMSESQNSYTLVQVLNELRPSFNDLNSLFAVHLSATSNWLNEPNWLCSVRIIINLYKAVLHSTCNRLGFLYMNMFLYCFQAYLDITDNWISCLCLKDPLDEFIIYRTEESCEPNNYSYSVRPYKDELLKIGLKEMEILDYLSDKMLYVGHSIDVLHRLDRSLIKESNFGSTHDSSYSKLLDSVKMELQRLEMIGNPVGECKEVALYQQGVLEDSNNNTNGARNVSCTLGPIDPVYKGARTTNTKPVAKEIALSEFCTKLLENDNSDVIETSIWPLCVIIDVNIKTILTSRVVNTCDLAKNVVVNEFQLKNHLRVLRNIFLFNEPHLFQRFMNTLFTQEQIWRNSYILTAHLRECIETRYRDQAQYFSVTLEDYSRPPRNILEAVDQITINYQVEWPLRLVCSPQIMVLYNNIFRHLLKIHWTHETLCKLQFTDENNKIPEIVKSSRRRLELLRFWCLSSLARLRSYFMAQISSPFDLHLNSYRHLKHIIKAHEAFIRKIHSRCLLDEETADGKELIFDTLIPVCYDVYTFWNVDRAIPNSKLSFIENLFFTFQKRFPRLMARLEEE